MIKYLNNEVLLNEVEQLMNNVDNWTSKYPHRNLDIDTSFRDIMGVETEYIENVRKLIKIRN